MFLWVFFFLKCQRIPTNLGIKSGNKRPESATAGLILLRSLELFCSAVIPHEELRKELMVEICRVGWKWNSNCQQKEQLMMGKVCWGPGEMCLTWSLAVKCTWVQLGALGIGCRSCVLIYSVPMMPKKSCGVSSSTCKNQNICHGNTLGTQPNIFFMEARIGKAKSQWKTWNVAGDHTWKEFFPAFLG